ncbi:MAG: hypothetical protein AAFQ04_04645 [Pseudomonadota bacterium]
MRCSKIFPVSFVAMTALAACGDTIPEQAILGGAAGVGGAVVVGAPVLTGAAIGAAGNVAYCQLGPGKCK